MKLVNYFFSSSYQGFLVLHLTVLEVIHDLTRHGLLLRSLDSFFPVLAPFAQQLELETS